MKATVLLGLGIIFALDVAVVKAQEPEAAPDEARQAYESGSAAFEEDDYPVALDHFRRAYEIAPNDAMRFNIGICLERLGRYREASFEYEAAMRSDQLDQTQRDRAARLMVRSRERLGTLVVTTTPAGADVDIDDGVLRCTSPCELPIDAGEHIVTVEGPDGPITETVSVRRGSPTNVPIDLRPEPDDVERPVMESRGVGALTWLGAGLVVAGGAAFAVLGVHTLNLHDEYVQEPTVERRDDGLLFRALTWTAGAGTAALGAILIIIDLAFLAGQEVERPVEATVDGLRINF